ncbi:hypothetical protein THIOKS12990002 [Thiocapsa sp. KS1]|nr:hypothetical protein THIOKS12990002 [Thiocapsa sp. KS1]
MGNRLESGVAVGVSSTHESPGPGVMRQAQGVLRAISEAVELSLIPLTAGTGEEDDCKSSIPGCCCFAAIIGVASGRSDE